MIDSSKVLLVDDSRTNLEVLASFLSGFEFKLLFASNGERALQVAGHAVPDLILLDILLPGIDGYETCRRLKADEGLAQIPVLFLSALDKVSDKVKGFEVGGVDYISKPFQKEELVARVRTHLELYRIRRENRRYALEMERLAQERARALIHADRLSTLGTLSAGVAHEVNNPATFISVGIQTLARLWPRLDSLLDQVASQAPDERGQITFARTHVPEIIENVKSGVMRIQKVVGALRTYAHADTSAKGSCDIAQCIAQARVLCANRLKSLAAVQASIPAQLPLISGDPQQIEQVLVNLFINAVDAMEGRTDSRLWITAGQADGQLRITVDDNGPGITPKAIERIWDPFFSTKEPDKGTGLGLSISKGIIEDHGGTIQVVNRAEGGARFTITLPVGPPAHDADPVA